MAKTKIVIHWIRILSIGALVGAIWVSLALYESALESNPFFATSSPGGRYTVNLTGQKQRPFFFTNTVNYHALRNGQPFIPSTYIHSGDFMDISFELAYPNHRWLSENILHLYREQYFTDSSPDTLIVSNGTDKIIKHLKVSSVDQFLLFDLPPNDEIRLLNSGPRGDFKHLHVIGEFYEGRRLEGGAGILMPNKKASGPSTYYVHINRDGATFGGPRY